MPLSVASFSSLFPILLPFCVLCLSWFVRGGVLAFQDVSFVPLLLFSSYLPLWSAGVSIVHETLQRARANTERDRARITADLPGNRAPTVLGLFWCSVSEINQPEQNGDCSHFSMLTFG